MNVNGSEAPKPELTVKERFQFALGDFLQARVGQMQRDGVDPVATAVNHSIQSVQFEALVGALITSGVITRDQFQLAVITAAGPMAKAFREVPPAILIAPSGLH